MTEHRPDRIRIMLLAALLSMVPLVLTFVVPFSFSGIEPGFLSGFWLFMSNTGGVIGVPVISLFFCVLIAYYQNGWRKRMWAITGVLLVFASMLGGIARFNEYVIKERVKEPRPYTLLLKNRFNFDISEFYSQPGKDARRNYLDSAMTSWGLNTQLLANKDVLDPDILEHWKDETGYSFPSGHSVNAFMMAMILGYIILYLYQDGFNRRFLFVLPFIWAELVALSRVAVGAHSSVDITMGALIGILTATAFISFGLLDKLIQPKKKLAE